MKTAVIVKFQHCDFGEHYAAAQTAYDTDAATAWILPFTLAQRAYWAQQGNGLVINGYAEDYAVGRSNSIDNSAQSTYATCIGSDASTNGTQVTEPGFRLSISTKLNGGTAAGSGKADKSLSTQLSVPFAPAAVQPQYPLDWRAFYRVGGINLNYNYADNWLLSFPTGGGYAEPSYTTLPMRPSIQVQAYNLVAIGADYVQYIDAPEGRSLSIPDSLEADFNAAQSHFQFTMQRWVYLPDGQIIQEEVDYDNGFNTGELSDVQATVNWSSELAASCDVSGTVDVYHFITAYSFGTLYRLANKIQQVRVNGVDYDFTVPADAAGSVPPSYGPPGYNSIHESFVYIHDELADLQVDYIWDYQSPLFYRAVFKLVNTSTQAMVVVLNFSGGYKCWVRVPSDSTKYYACFVPDGVGTLTVQRTATTPETNPSGLAEKEVSATCAIKVYSSTLQYDYSGVAGFTPKSKSVTKASGGAFSLPDTVIPDYLPIFYREGFGYFVGG